MRVLVAHNRYRSSAPSGENAVVEDDIKLLHEAGVDVLRMYEESDSIIDGGSLGMIRAATGPVYAPGGVRRFKRLLDDYRPDLIHIHNVYPLISPAVVRTAHRAGLPVVQTVHNYRHTCINALHFRDGAPCTDCVTSRLPSPAVRHRCYHGSLAQSTAMALGQVVHRSTWDLVDRYLVLSRFAADSLQAWGIPADRIVLRPTSARDPEPAGEPGRNILYVGRLSQEKGIDLLLDAWRRSRAGHTGWRLRVAGGGPMEDAVTAAAAAEPSIDYLGALAGAEVDAEYRAAGIVALPSRCFEGFPRVVAEALAHGRPVLASRLGSLATIIHPEFGLLADPTCDSWVNALDSLEGLDLRRLGAAGREHWQRWLSPSISRNTLLDTYRSAIESKQRPVLGART
jgi:glycosyltransferase involved in cell wall biosynthesis